MKKILAAAAAALCLGTLCHAQINGLRLWKAYTPEQLVAALGKPANARVIPGDTQYLPSHVRYEYADGTTVSVTDDGKIDAFDIKGKGFSAYSDLVEGGIRVGDPVGKLFHMKGVTPKKATWIQPEGLYALFMDADDYPIVSYDPKTMRITEIDYTPLP